MRTLLLDWPGQGLGVYMGLAFWPGGMVKDWGPAKISSAIALGLNPCVTTEYNQTNSTHQQYLVGKALNHWRMTLLSKVTASDLILGYSRRHRAWCLPHMKCVSTG